MPKKTHERSATGARKSYAPPSLTMYGGMAKLTASGTQPPSESQGGGFPAKLP
jgi:hypothetical protein